MVKEVFNLKKMFHLKYLLTILFFAILITLSFNASKQMFKNFELGKAVDVNVFSPKTVTFSDAEETSKQKEELLAQVQEVYELDPVIPKEQNININDFFGSIIEEKRRHEDDVATEKLKQQQQKETKTLTSVKNGVVSIQTSPYIKNIKNPYNFSEEELKLFFETSVVELNRMKEVFGKEIEKFYVSGITEEKIEESRFSFKNNSNFYFFDQSTRNLLLDKLVPALKANMILNEEETKKKREEATISLTPVMKTIQKGEMIVRKGEVLTPKHLISMKEVGILKDEFEFKEIFKKFPIVFVFLIILHAYMVKFSLNEVRNKRLYQFVYVMILIAVFTASFFQNEYFTYTILAISIITISSLLTPNIAIVYAIILGFLLNTGGYVFLLMAFTMGVMQTVLYDPKGDRISFLYLGIYMSMAVGVSYSTLTFVMSTPFMMSELYPLVAAPVIASILVQGIFPFLEKTLGVITSLRLHELSSPAHPLIQRLINETPGTFHHSLKVGSLAEAAADKIGANGLLLKVGAMYHDAGKLENPSYFIENLVDSNIPDPHGVLTHKESASIILQHPIDSVKLCRKHGIPEAIIELIEKHHGDDLVKFFYLKELEKNPDANVEDFKYKTPLPITKEEGILMLADITEASSRSIIHEEPSIFRKKMTDIIFQKIEHGQLRECELTMKEINIIIDTFIKHLVPANHKRPKYPNQN